MTLREDVAAKLSEIVEEYVDDSEIFDIDDIIDAEILGSNANYNYNDTSDIDLHLVVNMSDISNNTEIVQIASNLERSEFNKHYDIEIRDLQVELYVEDVRSGTMSNGIYSLFQNEWIRKPKKETIPDYPNDEEYLRLLDQWTDEANDILYNEKDYKVIKSFVDRLYNFRRISLMTDGEFAKGNLVFKQLRKSGIIEKLKDLQYKLTSERLSLD